MADEQGPRHLDPGAYPVLERIAVPAFELVLVDRDTLNTMGRDLGLPVQANALTVSAENRIYLGWPPYQKHDPKFEYGSDFRSVMAALGYELYSNLLHRDTDPWGR